MHSWSASHPQWWPCYINMSSSPPAHVPPCVILSHRDRLSVSRPHNSQKLLPHVCHAALRCLGFAKQRRNFCNAFHFGSPRNIPVVELKMQLPSFWTQGVFSWFLKRYHVGDTTICFSFVSKSPQGLMQLFFFQPTLVSLPVMLHFLYRQKWKNKPKKSLPLHHES